MGEQKNRLGKITNGLRNLKTVLGRILIPGEKLIRLPKILLISKITILY